MKLKRGAQPGNDNAFKHGFYSKIMRKAEIPALEQAGSIQGLDNEIAIVRLKLRQLLKYDPNNLPLIFQANSNLAKLLRTRNDLSPLQSDDLKKAIANVLRQVALPIGLNLSPEEETPFPSPLAAKPDPIPSPARDEGHSEVDKKLFQRPGEKGPETS